MHGLNTYQAVYPSTGFNGLPDAGNNLQKNIYFATCDDPLYLQATLFANPTPPSTSTEYWLKRLYRTWILTNTRPTPVYLELLKLRCRTSIPKNAAFIDVPTAVTTIMEDTTTPGSSVYPFLSNTTSPTLHKWFKIVSRRRITMRPGKPYTVKMRAQRRYFSKAIMPIAEGNTGDYVLCKGSSVCLFQVYGCPTYQTGETLNTTLLPYRVVMVARDYMSWYRMDDADVTNTVGTHWNASRATAIQQDYPSQFTGIRAPSTGGAPSSNPTVSWVAIPDNGGGNFLGNNSANQIHTVTP